jgi:hypothetical protein
VCDGVDIALYAELSWDWGNTWSLAWLQSSGRPAVLRDLVYDVGEVRTCVTRCVGHARFMIAAGDGFTGPPPVAFRLVVRREDTGALLALWWVEEGPRGVYRPSGLCWTAEAL